MRKKRLTAVFMFCLLLSGCGKSVEQTGAEGSVQWANYTFTEEGILHQNNSYKGKLGYFDYQTKSYRPLCGRVNCQHDSQECPSVYLGGTNAMGRIGNKWYYLMASEKNDGIPEFRCCDLDGQNEMVIGEFPHYCSYMELFFENSCVMATRDPVFDEKTGEITDQEVSGIYRYDFDTGKEELLCPEIKGEGENYVLYGRYENLLAYEERIGKKRLLRVMDLETKTITEPFGNSDVFSGRVNDRYLVCHVFENDVYKVIEMDLDSGEEKLVLDGLDHAASICWSPELKLLTIIDDTAGELYYQTYRYLDNGTCEVVREGGSNTYFRPITIKENLIVGQYEMNGEQEKKGFELAVMNKDDFLAGKNNWTILEY
ncbi:hypothetical protein [Fusibacillus kribbianus]|nr:hypothetical protein [Ruminococcus sp. YH-rum2234]